jgi:hypothetical protein
VVAIILIHRVISWLFSYPVYYYGSTTTFTALEAQGIKPHCTTLDSSSPFRSFIFAVQSLICFDTRQEIEHYIVSPTNPRIYPPHLCPSETRGYAFRFRLF